ncbi:11271_t:CDS:2, partial [Acaulospora colombiana]
NLDFLKILLDMMPDVFVPGLKQGFALISDVPKRVFYPPTYSPASGNPVSNQGALAYRNESTSIFVNSVSDGGVVYTTLRSYLGEEQGHGLRITLEKMGINGLSYAWPRLVDIPSTKCLDLTLSFHPWILFSRELKIEEITDIGLPNRLDIQILDEL